MKTLLGVFLVAACLSSGGAVAAGCPDPEDMLAHLEAVDTSRGSRTASFSVPAPRDLYARAVNAVGESFTRREGKQGLGVVVVERPAGKLWAAINDEDHHALDRSFLPVEHSEVIGGVPRGESRLLFQFFRRWGVGRWWVSQVDINHELFHATRGALWEVRWEDRMADADHEHPAIRDVASTMAPIRSSRGAWLLVPLSERCTLVEYYTDSDVGGAIGWTQALVARRAIRATLAGVVRMAAEHVEAPHAGATFVGPGGLARATAGR